MGSREKIQKTMLWHSIYGVLLTPWWMTQFIWDSSNEIWPVWLQSGIMNFHNIRLCILAHWQQFFLLISSFPSNMRLVQIFWHHFVKILSNAYLTIFMSGGDDEDLLKLISQTNYWLIGSRNPCCLPSPVMWLWVVLLLKSSLSSVLSIWTWFIPSPELYMI